MSTRSRCIITAHASLLLKAAFSHDLAIEPSPCSYLQGNDLSALPQRAALTEGFWKFSSCTDRRQTWIGPRLVCLNFKSSKYNRSAKACLSGSSFSHSGTLSCSAAQFEAHINPDVTSHRDCGKVVSPKALRLLVKGGS